MISWSLQSFPGRAQASWSCPFPNPRSPSRALQTSRAPTRSREDFHNRDISYMYLYISYTTMRCFFIFAFHLEQHLWKSWHNVFCFFDILFSLTGKPVVNNDFFTFTFHFPHFVYVPDHLITMLLHLMCNMDHPFLSVTVIFLVSFPSDWSFQAFKRGVRVFSDLRIEVEVFPISFLPKMTKYYW